MNAYIAAVKWFFGCQTDRQAKLLIRDDLMPKELVYIRSEYEREMKAK